MSEDFKIVYGDIHNHNAHGYGVGSIERSVDVARTHLDFFAFTGHSSWHDLGTIENGAEAHFNWEPKSGSYVPIISEDNVGPLPWES